MLRTEVGPIKVCCKEVDYKLVINLTPALHPANASRVMFAAISIHETHKIDYLVTSSQVHTEIGY